MTDRIVGIEERVRLAGPGGKKPFMMSNLPSAPVFADLQNKVFASQSGEEIL